jgi:CIC family chloride channel protein
MVLEVSGNYSIILPVILANTIAYLFARSLEPIPIFELFTHQDGLYLPSMEEQREESTLHFEDALLPVNLPIIQGNQSIWSAKSSLDQDANAANATAILVQCRDAQWYAARHDELSDLFAMFERQDDPGASDTLESILPPERTPLIFPDQPLSAALPYFRRWPVVPISNRATRGALEGVLSLDDVLKRYQRQ